MLNKSTQEKIVRKESVCSLQILALWPNAHAHIHALQLLSSTTPSNTWKACFQTCTCYFSHMHTSSTALPSSPVGCHLYLIHTAATERPLLLQASTKQHTVKTLEGISGLRWTLIEQVDAKKKKHRKDAWMDKSASGYTETWTCFQDNGLM